MPQAFEPGPPGEDYVAAGNPYAESFPRNLPDLRTRGVACGHFIPEEQPEIVTRELLHFLG